MSLLQSAQNVFFVGIKGVAMAGLAVILTQMGKRVSGSDTEEKQITDKIISKFAFQTQSLGQSLPSNTDLVVYSAAHGGVQSSQVKEASTRGIHSIHQAALIAELIAFFPRSIAICGCHGKTSTTALVAYTLEQLSAQPSWLVGAPYFRGLSDNSDVSSTDESAKRETREFLGSNYNSNSSIFVFEADEYGISPPQDKTPKLLLYRPTHILCTNVDFDHPDIYKDLSHVHVTFDKFFAYAQHVYECNSNSIQDNMRGVTTMLVDMGYARDQVERAMSGFLGVARRLESHGNKSGITFIDDYAHHPAEIRVALRFIREKYPKSRIVVAFQSHTYARTLTFLSEFVEALALADAVLIDSIFPSAREISTSDKLSALDVQNAARTKGYTHIKGFTDRNQLIAHVKSILAPHDVFVTLGAGSIYQIIDEIKSSL